MIDYDLICDFDDGATMGVLAEETKPECEDHPRFSASACPRCDATAASIRLLARTLGCDPWRSIGHASGASTP